MSAADTGWSGADRLRWGLAFGLVLLAHGALAAALLVRSPPPADGTPLDAISIDLSPEASTDARPDEVAGPEITESVEPTADASSEPEPPAPDSLPPEFAEPKPVTEAAPELTAPPAPATSEVLLPPAPEEPARREPVAEREPEPKPPEEVEKPAREERRTVASQASAGATAAVAGGARPSAAAIATWSAKLSTHLAHHKRYPVEARSRRQQGTATLQVTLDAAGRVLSRQVVKGSGAALLDQESLAMVLRAQPLPKPPPNMPVPVTLNVPVRFSIR